MCGVRDVRGCAAFLGQKRTLCGVERLGRIGNLERLGREYWAEAQLFVAIAFTFREKFIYLHHCPYIQRYKILKI